MKLEQIFCGMGPDGCGVLGASPAAAALAERVIALCQSIGAPAPEHLEDETPFLLQRVSDGQVLMACFRGGVPDSRGRPALLCHVLVAGLQEARRENVSAADLFDGGLFAKKAGDGAVKALDVDMRALRRVPRQKAEVLQLPAVVRCRRADNLKVLDLVGRNLVGTDWATFGWAPQKGCRFQGVDAGLGTVKLDPELSVYDDMGGLLRPAAVKTFAGDTFGKAPAENPWAVYWARFVAVWLGGLVLGGVLGYQRGSDGTAAAVARERVAGDVRAAEARTNLVRQVREEFRRENAESKGLGADAIFDEQNRLKAASYEDLLRQLGLAYFVEKTPEEMTDEQLRVGEILKRVGAYVKFVNAHFPERTGDGQAEKVQAENEQAEKVQTEKVQE